MLNYQLPSNVLSISNHFLLAYFNKNSAPSSPDFKLCNDSTSLTTEADIKAVTTATNTDDEAISLYNEQNSVVSWQSNKNHPRKHKLDRSIDTNTKFKSQLIKKQEFQFYGLNEVGIQTDISFNKGILTKRPPLLIGQKRIKPEIIVEHDERKIPKKVLKENCDTLNSQLLIINKILKDDNK